MVPVPIPPLASRRGRQRTSSNSIPVVAPNDKKQDNNSNTNKETTTSNNNNNKTTTTLSSSPSKPGGSSLLFLGSTATSANQTQKLPPPCAQSQAHSSSSNKNNNEDSKENNKNDKKNQERSDGIKITRNLKVLEESADQGDPEAQYQLGLFYHQESVGGNHSVLFAKQAARYWSSAAQQGHAKAQFAFGQCYHDGHVGLASLVQDAAPTSQPMPLSHRLRTAVSWYSPAAAQFYLESGGTGGSNNLNKEELVEKVLRAHETKDQAFFDGIVESVIPAPPSSLQHLVGDSSNLGDSENNKNSKNDRTASSLALGLPTPSSSFSTTIARNSKKPPPNLSTMENSKAAPCFGLLLSSNKTTHPPSFGRGPAKLAFKIRKRQHLKQQQEYQQKTYSPTTADVPCQHPPAFPQAVAMPAKKKPKSKTTAAAARKTNSASTRLKPPALPAVQPAPDAMVFKSAAAAKTTKTRKKTTNFQKKKRKRGEGNNNVAVSQKAAKTKKMQKTDQPKQPPVSRQTSPSQVAIASSRVAVAPSRLAEVAPSHIAAAPSQVGRAYQERDFGASTRRRGWGATVAETLVPPQVVENWQAYQERDFAASARQRGRCVVIAEEPSALLHKDNNKENHPNNAPNTVLSAKAFSSSKLSFSSPSSSSTTSQIARDLSLSPLVATQHADSSSTTPLRQRCTSPLPWSKNLIGHRDETASAPAHPTAETRDKMEEFDSTQMPLLI